MYVLANCTDPKYIQLPIGKWNDSLHRTPKLTDGVLKVTLSKDIIETKTLISDNCPNQKFYKVTENIHYYLTLIPF